MFLYEVKQVDCCSRMMRCVLLCTLEVLEEPEALEELEELEQLG